MIDSKAMKVFESEKNENLVQFNGSIVSDGC